MEQKSNALAVTGLILGIISVVFTFLFTWIGLIAGIVGIVLSVKGRKSEKKEWLLLEWCYQLLEHL